MKKILILLFIFPLFFACSSDDDDNGDDKKEETPNELVGTSWKGRHTLGYSLYIIYSFKQNNECDVEFSYFEDFSNSGTGKRLYEYNNNKVIIKSTTNQVLFTGTVNLEKGEIGFPNDFSFTDIFKKE